MNKPHIVHILTSLRTGGAETLTVNLLKTFDKHKYEYSLITLYSPEEDNYLMRQLRLSNIPYYHLGKQIGFSPRNSLLLRNLFKELKPNLIHSHMYTIKYVLLSYIGSHLPPWIHTLHTVTRSELTFFERKISFLLYRLHKVIPVAVSESVQQSFNETYGIKGIKVIKNGVAIPEIETNERDEFRERFNIKRDDFVITSVARLAPPKTPLLLVDAFAVVRNKIRNCFLFIVGDGPLMPVLKRMVTQLNLVDSVLFTGLVNNPFPYLMASDLFIFSSAEEGLPLSLLEAMAAGLPVVASKVGGIPEVIKEGYNGYLVPPNNMSALAEAVIKMYGNKGRQTIGKNNREVVKEYFDITHTASQYEKIYDRLLSR